MNNDIEARVREHLKAEAELIEDAPFVAGRPKALAQRRDWTRAGIAGLAILAGGIGLVSLQSAPANTVDTLSSRRTSATVPTTNQAEPLVWEEIALPGGAEAVGTVAIGTEFFVLTDQHQIMRSGDGRAWVPIANQPTGADAYALQASGGVLIVWGPPADLPVDSPLRSTTQVLTSTDLGATWQSSGIVGLSTEEQDSSPYVSASETVIDVEVLDQTLVVATSVGVNVDHDQILLDLGLLQPGETNRSTLSYGFGEPGIQIWLDGEMSDTPDVSLTHDDLGMTDAEKQAVNGNGGQGPFVGAIGTQLERLDLGEGRRLDSLTIVDDRLVAVASGNEGMVRLTTSDAESWVTEQQSAFVHSLTERAGVMFGTDSMTGDVQESNDNGRSWGPITGLEPVRGQAWAGPGGILVIAESGERFDSLPSPNTLAFWSDGQGEWTKHDMSAGFLPEGSYPTASIGAEHIVVVHRLIESGDLLQSTVLRVADIPK